MAMEGSLIGSYKIERPLGRGGFGVVYVGVDTRLGRRAAIKQLLPELSGHRIIVERFFNEAKAAANINHPGIIEIYDVGWHTDGSAYFAMKLLEGDSLGKRLKTEGQLPVTLAATIARQVASALGAAHAAGIVHRDLKPDNIILVPDEEIAIGERAVVLDFGIAKLSVDNPTVHTKSGVMMGTPKYMSPEQCKGAGEVDHRTDIYALGCILFEMLTGRVPFVGEGPGEIMGMHQFVDLPTVRSLRPDVPAELEAVVMKLLAKKLDQRTQKMSELVSALKPFGTGGKAPIEPKRRDSGIEETVTKPFFVLPDNTDTAYVLPKDPVSVAAKAALSPPRTEAPALPAPPVVAAPAPRSPPRVEPPSSPSVIRGEIDIPDPPNPRRTLYFVLGGAALLGIIIAIAVGSSGGTNVAAPEPTPPDAQPVAKLVVDAAAPVAIDAAIPVAIDAPPVPVSADAKVVVERCKSALSSRSWVQLADCGKELKQLGNATGDSFIQLALDEASAEVELRNLARAHQKNDLKEGQRLLAKIPVGSTYYGEAKQYVDAMRPVRPGKEPAREPANNPCKDMQRIADLEAKADANQAAGNYATALESYELVLRCKPGATTKAYLAACRARSFAKAKQLFKRIGKESLSQICQKEGFDPRD